MDIYEEQRQRLKEIRNSLGLSQAQFAAKLPYPLSSIAAIEAGNQKMPIMFVFKLQDSIVSDANGHIRIVSEDNPKQDDEYYFSSEWLLRGTGEPFDYGKFVSSSNSLNLQIFNEKKQFRLQMEDIVFFVIKDNAMENLFKKNDLVAINTKKTDIVSGQVYLVKIFDEFLIRKLFVIESNTVLLIPENKEYAPSITADRKEFEIIGAYKYLVRNN